MLLASCAPTGAPTLALTSTPATPSLRGDAAAMPPVAPQLSLEFIDDFNPPRPSPGAPLEAPGAGWDAALGGLSGLHYDHGSATLYAVSDLHRRFAPRFYAFDVELTERSLGISPKTVTFFREVVSTGLLAGLDAETIAGDGGGGFFISCENYIENRLQSVPRVLRVQRDGLISSGLPLPADYLPASEPTPRGTRSNRAFEGLAVSPSGRWLTVIAESTLEQDGDEANFEHGASVRVLRWELGTGAAPTEFFYPIEPMRRPLHGTPAGGNNGVSELLSLDDQRLLVLERGYVPLAEGKGPNTIRLFETSLPRDPAPAGAPPQTLTKRLVLDLDDIVPRLEPGQRSLDNMEGMTLGPTLRSGEPSLIIVSDDNFRVEQRTVFLAFRVRGLSGP